MSNILQQSLSTAFSVVTAPVVGVLVIGTKFAYLAPLLVRWNESSSPQSAYLRNWKLEDLVSCTGKANQDNGIYPHVVWTPRSRLLIYPAAPVSRVGIHQVAVHDREVARQVLKGDVKAVEGRMRSRSVISRSNMVLSGFHIPAGTLIEIDVTPEEC
jgi:hypothetical protein